MIEPFTAHYVFALGVSRFLGCAHWIIQVSIYSFCNFLISKWKIPFVGIMEPPKLCFVPLKSVNQMVQISASNFCCDHWSVKSVYPKKVWNFKLWPLLWDRVCITYNTRTLTPLAWIYIHTYIYIGGFIYSHSSAGIWYCRSISLLDWKRVFMGTYGFALRDRPNIHISWFLLLLHQEVSFS